MNKGPDLDVNIIGTAIKTHVAESENYRVEVNLRNVTYRSVEFYIRIRILKPSARSSYPQMKLALERHEIGEGHDFIHIQVQMHKYENSMKIGKMYIKIDAETDMELLNIAKGFLCSLYDVLKRMSPEIAELADEVFHHHIIDSWRDAVSFYHNAVLDSINRYGLEIVDLDNNKRMIRSTDELERFLDSREELMPLIGPTNS